jgi:hypothetical protein
MSKDRSFKNAISYLATAASTLIGVLGLFFSLSKLLNLRDFFAAHELLVKVLISISGVVVGVLVTKFVDGALRRKGGAGD